MNTISTTPGVNSEQARMKAAPAANDDRVSDEVQKFESTSSSWDAYDVWRRFIKEARDRRDRNPS